MTAPTDSAAQPAAFVRRADWSDENNYPPDDMADASAWAWKFLRRNRKYQEGRSPKVGKCLRRRARTVVRRYDANRRRSCSAGSAPR